MTNTATPQTDYEQLLGELARQGQPTYEARLTELARKHHPGVTTWWREQPYQGCKSIRCLVCGAVLWVWPAGRRRPKTADYLRSHHYARHAVELMGL